MRTLLAWWALAMVLGCSREVASPEDCRLILDRIVEVELRERGYRDAVLLERKKEELRRLLSPELRRCEGRGLRGNAIDCVRKASSNEEISHRCLR
jgi:hypothetical protein